MKMVISCTSLTVPSGLLAPSDDSDDDGSEQMPTQRRFHKTTQRFPVDIRLCHWLFLCVLSISVICIAVNVYILTKRCAELSDSASSITTLVNRINSLESNLEKLLLEFDLWRENIPKNSNQTKNATKYVYDVMEYLNTQVEQIKKNVDHASGVADDVTRRMTTVETRCLAVCRQTTGRDRDKQRRRQAGSTIDHTDDVIVFQRN
ncbi:hypothetical protein KIN20_036680 [Parelaphostrongylus tenuis]|uniref:Uncharacterized protein n=1 Tax=Parelaphostrongylus tenuis TaxID=148309 RepID=A0AAD5RDE1_PARTN|nr:hypothetical protein KIN20_036680 [Parelaphostrongylus tenuis]